MKKVLSLTLALVLTMVLFCGAVAEAVDLSGVWYCNFGAIITLTLNEDGTYAIDMSALGMEDEAGIETGTWSFDGTNGVMDEGTEAEAPFTFADGVINVGDMFNFTREMPEIFTPAAVKADAAIEDFAGTWATTQISMMGLTVAPADAGMDLKFVIDGTKVTLDFQIEDGSEPEEPVTIEGTFADGALTIVDVSDSEYVEDTVFAVNALEDGMLCASMNLLGMDICFYLEKAE